MVAGRLHQGRTRAQPRQAVDAAIHRARFRGGLPPGAAPERGFVARISEALCGTSPRVAVAHAGYDRSLHRLAVLVDAHAGIAQGPFLDDLPAFLQIGRFRWSARRRCGPSVLDYRLAGVESVTFARHGVRGAGKQRGGHQRNQQPHASRCRASLAPAPRAISLASAISRRIGAMPQLVVATILAFGTNLATSSITLTTSSAVSTVSLATSITPACTTLFGSRPSNSSGTCELRHSIATCWIVLLSIEGNVSSYCRHSPPSVCFQSVLALMP